MMRTIKGLIGLTILGLLLTSGVYGIETVIQDKPGANTLIPVMAEDVVLVKGTVFYGVMPRDEAATSASFIEDPDDVDRYRGHAIVKAEWVLRHEGIVEPEDDTPVVVLAVPYDPTDQGLTITVDGSPYDPERIEVDRLTNYYGEGLSLSGEYLVTRQQVVDRIRQSMQDGISRYVTGDWQEVYLIVLEMAPGTMKQVTITYEEWSGASRRGSNIKTRMPWEPEFYYFFDYMNFFKTVENIEILMRLPADYEIGHTSLPDFEMISPNVYGLNFSERPKTNLIFTVHDPNLEPEDTGFTQRVKRTYQLVILASGLIVIALMLLVFYSLIWPKLQPKWSNWLSFKQLLRRSKSVEDEVTEDVAEGEVTEDVAEGEVTESEDTEALEEKIEEENPL